MDAAHVLSAEKTFPVSQFRDHGIVRLKVAMISCYSVQFQAFMYARFVYVEFQNFSVVIDCVDKITPV